MNKWRSPEFVPPLKYAEQAYEIPSRERRNGSVPLLQTFDSERFKARQPSPMRTFDMTKSYDMKSPPKVFEPKKIFTYNILSNRPVERELHPNTKIPYRYAIPIDPAKFNSEIMSLNPSHSSKDYGLDNFPHKQQ